MKIARVTVRRLAVLVAALGVLVAPARANADAAPEPPALLFPQINGDAVSLTWIPSTSGTVPTSYIVEAGSAPRRADIAVFATGTADTTFNLAGVPRGLYYVRVRAVGAAGVSAPSNEGIVSVGACPVTPAVPGNPSFLIFGTTVRIEWSQTQAGCAPTEYLLDIGSGPGLSDLGTLTVAATPLVSVLETIAPPGVYYLRVRARNAAGTSPASEEIRVDVGCLPIAPLSDFTAVAQGNAATFRWARSVPQGFALPTAFLVEAGSAPGANDLATLTVPRAALTPTGLPDDGHAEFTVYGPPGSYWTRVRPITSCTSGPVSANTLLTLTDTCVVPGPPQGLDATGQPGGTTGTAFFRWRRPETGPPATDYRIDVGSAPGLTDIGSLIYAAAPRLELDVPRAPQGTYFARIVAHNQCGFGVPSSEVSFTVGGSCELPTAPYGYAPIVTGQTVTLRWHNFPSDYRLSIGTTEGGSEVAADVTGPFTPQDFYLTYQATLKPGQYFARLTRVDSCGTSNPSVEFRFVIPQ